MWCSTPTCSSLAKTSNFRFGVLSVDVLQEYVRAEVADLARVPDEGERKESAQLINPEEKTRPSIRSLKKAKAKLGPTPGPAGFPQTSKRGLFNEEAGRRRAITLKEDCPGIKDVPPVITKSVRKLLVASYRATRAAAQQDGPENKPRSQHPQPSRGGFRSGKTTNLPGRASHDAAPISHGNSAEHPIDLD